jgi:hypothetical protein
MYLHWESLVSDIPAGDRKIANLFLQCTHDDLYLLLWGRGETAVLYVRKLTLSQSSCVSPVALTDGGGGG